MIRDYEEYYQGKIPKSKYIEKMWKYHQFLFDYAKFIEKTDISSLTIEDGRLIAKFKTFPISLYIPPDDRRTPPIEAINFGEYEGAYSRKMLELMKGCKVIFDVGANIGYYSIAAGACYPSAEVYSFEPTPATYLQLEENINLNRLPNIYPIHFALSDSNGVCKIYYDKEESGAASFRDIREKNVTPISVQQTTMDAFVLERGLAPDFIKCDVEGAELFVFKGAREVLKSARPIIFVEILRKWCRKFGHEAGDVFEFLKEFNYIPHVLEGECLISIDSITEDTKETNFIFIPA